MMNAVHHPNLIEVEWAYPLQASDIHATLFLFFCDAGSEV
jgi:hypothetical protein